MANMEVMSALNTFKSTKLYIQTQKDEFFRRGVSVRSSTTTDETPTKSEDIHTQTTECPSNNVNPLELDADIAHFRVCLPYIYV
jgi:hypothetical protein